MSKINGSIQKGTWELKTPFDGVTATTTSNEIIISGARKVTWFFTRADHSSGQTVFDVDVAIDGTTYVDFNQLISNIARDAGAGTAGEDIGYTAVASVTLTDDGTEMYSMDLTHHSFYSMKVTATETTDGTHTAKCLIEW